MGALLSSIPLWIRLAQKVACSHWNAFYYGHLELFILNTFMAASIFNVVALTVERYTSVCLAGQFPKIHTPLRAKMAVATSFLLGLIVSFPLCILKYVVVNSEEEMMAKNLSECRFQYLENRNVTAHPLWTAYVWIGESLVRFLPGLILVILNMLILIKYHGVVKTRRQMQRGQPNANANGNNGRSDRNLEQERKLLTLLLSIIVLFFITNIPSAVLSIIYDQELEDSHSFQVFRAVANLLEMSNFALNFCMYFLCSKEFRKMLYKAMPQCGFSKFFILSSTTSKRKPQINVNMATVKTTVLE
ncbi:probable G-protein coupled receptor B0563.6 isoform X2 [Daphnia pulicaria]|uniref:probable G-protein coupled receptor B0563.6 isoform X2 n=1 Tax=Daphnia pulicaria TaxID=35523 RepID=UPI001EEB39A1|nr:probable G-protein coupled receptor B0563.6 isoform X2 [Daphnia pulicaria]XP_046643118.1 probable G-protein coupled receptor B0563.6 isoform X2 [Daphnia pulicaria]